MTRAAKDTFDVTVQPAAAELDGAVGGFELSKTFHGDIEATGAGIMPAAGDPGSGSAGYVARTRRWQARRAQTG